MARSKQTSGDAYNGTIERSQSEDVRLISWPDMPIYTGFTTAFDSMFHVTVLSGKKPHDHNSGGKPFHSITSSFFLRAPSLSTATSAREALLSSEVAGAMDALVDNLEKEFRRLESYSIDERRNVYRSDLTISVTGAFPVRKCHRC